jgi:hypothetical protein
MVHLFALPDLIYGKLEQNEATAKRLFRQAG